MAVLGTLLRPPVELIGQTAGVPGGPVVPAGPFVKASGGVTLLALAPGEEWVVSDTSVSLEIQYATDPAGPWAVLSGDGVAMVLDGSGVKRSAGVPIATLARADIYLRAVAPDGTTLAASRSAYDASTYTHARVVVDTANAGALSLLEVQFLDYVAPPTPDVPPGEEPLPTIGTLPITTQSGDVTGGVDDQCVPGMVLIDQRTARSYVAFSSAYGTPLTDVWGRFVTKYGDDWSGASAGTDLWLIQTGDPDVEDGGRHHFLFAHDAFTGLDNRIYLRRFHRDTGFVDYVDIANGAAALYTGECMEVIIRARMSGTTMATDLWLRELGSPSATHYGPFTSDVGQSGIRYVLTGHSVEHGTLAGRQWIGQVQVVDGNEYPNPWGVL